MSENSPEKIMARLASPKEYSLTDMRADLAYLLAREQRASEIFEEALRHPDSKVKVDAGGLMVLQRQYQQELKNHQDTRKTLEILQEQHTNLQKWIRDKKLVDPHVIEAMERLSPEDIDKLVFGKSKK